MHPHAFICYFAVGFRLCGLSFFFYNLASTQFFVFFFMFDIQCQVADNRTMWNNLLLRPGTTEPVYKKYYVILPGRRETQMTERGIGIYIYIYITYLFPCRFAPKISDVTVKFDL